METFLRESNACLFLVLPEILDSPTNYFDQSLFRIIMNYGDVTLGHFIQRARALMIIKQARSTKDMEDGLG